MTKRIHSQFNLSSKSNAALPSSTESHKALPSSIKYRSIKTTIISSMYGIKKSDLTAAELIQIRKELTAERKEDFTERVMRFAVYTETDQMLWTPRFYGLKKWGLPVTDKTRLGSLMNQDLVCSLPLDPKRHQIKAAQAIERAFRNPALHGGILSLPCGYGKTRLAIEASLNIIKRIEGKTYRTLIIVHTSVLLQQWIERINTYAPGAKVGILQQDRMEIDGYDFVIGMLHSIVLRDYDLSSFGCILLDECHHLCTRMFSCALPKIPAKYILGLSATPTRADGLTHVLHWFMGALVDVFDRNAGESAQIKMIWYSNPDFKELKMKNGKPLVIRMQRIMSRCVERNQLIIGEILKIVQNPKRHLIVFSKFLEHLDIIEALLLKAGISKDRIGFYTGPTSIPQRAINRHKQIVLSTVHIGKEGLDIDTLNAMLFALPVGDLSQIIFRLRTIQSSAGSSDCPPLVIDIADPYTLFWGMAKKRIRQYNELGYPIRRYEYPNVDYVGDQEEETGNETEEPINCKSQKLITDIFRVR